MILPDPGLYENWKDWARQVLMTVEDLERKISSLEERVSELEP